MLCTAFSACTKKDTGNTADTAGVTDEAGSTATTSTDTSSTDNTASVKELETIVNSGKLKVGITEYKPMDYQENGEWTGFDVEFGKAFCGKLGIEPEFIVIDWDNRFTELKSKAIDCIWNGMTISDDAKKNTSVSNPYVKNAQVAVMKADTVSKYARAESLKDLTFAAEKGSAGEEVLNDLGYNVIGVNAQSDALMEVASGSTDACVIDITMANAMTGEGTSYSNLAIACELSSEEYGVSFRTGSDMVEKFNTVMAELMADGTLDALAEKYSLTLIK